MAALHHMRLRRGLRVELARKSFLLALVAGLGVGACGDDSTSAAPPSSNAGGLGGESGEPSQGSGEGGVGTSGAGAANEAGDSGSAGAITPLGCGDGERSEEEQCDDGNLEPGDGCDEDCRLEPACGDGREDDGEECDDGNLDRGDGCDDRCREERCGNARVDPGEQCDPPNGDDCLAGCRRPNCGNGNVESDEEEQCDDGNETPGDGCFNCQNECGDGRIDRSIGEECESAYDPDHELCSESCRWLPVCGDGTVDAEGGEECDPSNGVTCKSCLHAEPPPSGCEGGAGGVGSGGEGGGCQGPAECVPQGALSGLLTNPRFDTDILGWSPHSTSISLLAVDDGDPAPKALEVVFARGSSRAISGAFQCIPVKPDETYEFSARYKVPGDAPAGVGVSVTATLYAGTRCDGPFASVSNGSLESARDTWSSYRHTLSTEALSEPGRLMLRLNALRPGDVAGTRVLWDSVELTGPEFLCGNCRLDAGETCDDGNRTAGDGCAPTCSVELCGDGQLDGAEQCDDGNNAYGAANDSCTPSCKAPSACDQCARSSCAAALDPCLAVAGDAADGPGRGKARSLLCDELRSCVHRTACHLAERTSAGVRGAFLENCLCGTAGAACFEDPGAPNGSCRSEVQAALETSELARLQGRLSGNDARYPLFAALDELLACEGRACSAACVKEAVCGDGALQDRNLDYTFVVDREEVPCDDALTHTKLGCSLEECDDGNQVTGDGCDEFCFVEACGNNVVQAGEGCDDGNTEDDDGCSPTCQPEYVCGDSERDPRFEECDPPGGDYLCTLEELENNPSLCGCDARCRRLACGNGVLQRPAEECDPPNGFSCGEDCRSLQESPCEECLNTEPTVAYINELYCNPDANCVEVKQCVLAEGCFLPTPFSCYCGADLQTCVTSTTFTPTGPCAEEIVAGAGNGTHTQVLERLSSADYASGIAFLMLTEASSVCAEECF
jgi:cysteine-rich repeat protein